MTADKNKEVRSKIPTREEAEKIRDDFYAHINEFHDKGQRINIVASFVIDSEECTVCGLTTRSSGRELINSLKVILEQCTNPDSPYYPASMLAGYNILKREMKEVK